MEGFAHLLADVFRNAVMVTGMVTVMMMMIECINLRSHGRSFASLKGAPFRQIVLSALFGLVPGCLGGFAAVSLYTHRIIGAGALVAMMIATSGDEAFVMLATVPRHFLVLSLLLFFIAVAAGWAVHCLFRRRDPLSGGGHGLELHPSDTDEGDALPEEHPDGLAAEQREGFHQMRRPSWRRIVLLSATALYLAALGAGLLEHDHAHGHGTSPGTLSGPVHETHAGCTHEHGAEACLHTGGHMPDDLHGARRTDLFSEYWINLLFALLSTLLLLYMMRAREHTVRVHFWQHVICHHLPRIFAWTFGTMLLVEAGMHYFDPGPWMHGNVPLMILLAVLVGMIPESGPHLLFVTLFAAGMAPFSVLLSSSVAQDGHACLPLLAESKRSFFRAKAVNMAVALAAGFGAYFLGF